MESNNNPYSTEAEQSVLGAVIADPKILPEVMERLKPEYFFNQNHKFIYSAIMKMYSDSMPTDIVTILDELQKMKVFNTIEEGRRYLAEIANMLPTTANVSSYCNIVIEKYLLRSLSEIAGKIKENINKGDNNPYVLLDSVEQQIYELRREQSIKGLLPL